MEGERLGGKWWRWEGRGWEGGGGDGRGEVGREVVEMVEVERRAVCWPISRWKLCCHHPAMKHDFSVRA